MAVIVTVTKIWAPVERVFDLSRSVDLHVQSTRDTEETIAAGVNRGLLTLGDEVTWRGKHFGIWQNLSSKVVRFSPPNYFRDSMVRGAFKRFDHDHYFQEQGDHTMMKDVFDFTAPFGLLGRLAEFGFLESYVRRFLSERNDVIKQTAEGQDWKRYLPPA